MEESQRSKQGTLSSDMVPRCRPIELGGLDLHDLEALGWALLMKWLWMEKNSTRSAMDRP